MPIDQETNPHLNSSIDAIEDAADADATPTESEDRLHLPMNPETGGVDHAAILRQIPFDDIQLRSYQLSLAESGLKGDNSIVVLQTGGGKTHIAAYVTKYHR